MDDLLRVKVVKALQDLEDVESDEALIELAERLDRRTKGTILNKPGAGGLLSMIVLGGKNGVSQTHSRTMLSVSSSRIMPSYLTMLGCASRLRSSTSFITSVTSASLRPSSRIRLTATAWPVDILSARYTEPNWPLPIQLPRDCERGEKSSQTSAR